MTGLGDKVHMKWAPWSCWEIFIILFTAGLTTFLVFDQPNFVQDAIDADLVVPGTFFWDILHRAGAWGAFELPRIPSFFPDLLVFGVGQLATGSWKFGYFFYGLVAFTTLILMAGRIIQSQSEGGLARGCMAFLLWALPILAVELWPGTPAEAAIHTWIFRPISHGGMFVLSLAALGLALGNLNRLRWYLLVPLFLASVLGLVSDLLILSNFVGPLCVAMGYFSWRRSVRPANCAVVAATVAAALAVGLAIDHAMPRQSVSHLLIWSDIPSHAAAFLVSPFYPLGVDAPFAILLGLGLPLSGLVLGCPRPLSRDRVIHVEPATFWWIAGTVGVLGSVLVTALMYAEVHSYRYAEALLWWPVIMVSSVVNRRVRVGSRFYPAVPFAAMTASLIALAGFHKPALFAADDPLLSCIQDQPGLEAGLGGLNYANYLLAESDWSVQMEVLFDPDGGAFHILNDPYWYLHDRRDPSRPPPFNFIVMTPPPDADALASLRRTFGRGAKEFWRAHRFAGLNKDLIRSLYGAPDRVVSCPSSRGATRRTSSSVDLWIYDRPGQLFDRLVGVSRLLWPSMIAEGRSVCAPPQRLSGTGASTSADAITVQLGTAGGVATYGPYVDLPPGRYVFSLLYRLDGQDRGGDQWLVTALSGKRPLFSGPLPATGSAFATVDAELAVPADAHDQVELVTVLGGAGAIEVKGVGISPVGGAGERHPCGSSLTD